MANKPIKGEAWAKDGKYFSSPARDADLDIDYKKVKEICEQIENDLNTGFSKVKKKLKLVRFEDDVLLVSDKNMKRTIEDFADTLDQIPNNITSSLEELKERVKTKHHKLQDEYNDDAQKKAEAKRNEYENSLA